MVFSRLALVLISDSTVVACADDITEPPPPTVASVIVSPPAATLSDIGATQAFTAEALDADRNLIPSTSVTWTSQNPIFATVDENGIAGAVASGQVTVTAEIDGTLGHALLTISVPDVPPVTSWTVEIPPSPTLYDVWAASSTDVYAVGASGTILHYDGAEWSAELSPDGYWYYVVWGTSSTDVYAVGWMGTIVHCDGTRWSPMERLPVPDLRGIWGTSAGDVYVVGEGASSSGGLGEGRV